MRNLRNILANDYMYVILTSSISTIVFIVLYFRNYLFFSWDDAVWPLSSNIFYNYEFFYTNVNGGSIATNPNILLLLLFPFFNRYSEIISFSFNIFLGNLGISMIARKFILKYKMSINLFTYIVPIFSELFLSSGLNLLYELYIFSSAFIPLYSAYPWAVYLIQSVIMDKDSLPIKFLKIILVALIQIIFGGSTLTLVYPSYLFLASVYIIALYLSDLSKMRKILFTIFPAAVLFILNYISLLSSYIEATKYYPSHVGNTYFIIELENYLNNFNSTPLNTITLTYFPNTFQVPHFLIYISILPILLGFMGFLIKKRYYPLYIGSVASLIFLLIWLSIPYIYPNYVNVFSKTPYLWSLDIPWLSFTFFIYLALSISILLGVLSLNIKKYARILISIALAIMVIFSLGPYTVGLPYNEKLPGQNFPQYLWEASSSMSSNIFNPRIVVFPLSFTYLSYNFSKDNVYVGAGFWQTLFKGDVYSSYFNPHTQTLEFYITIYPYDFSQYTPLVNALKLLGINYIVVTKNNINNYSALNSFLNVYAVIPKPNEEGISSLNNFLNSTHRIIYSNNDLVVYNFSTESLVSPIKYIILVNISTNIYNPSNVNCVTQDYTELTKALNIKFVNYSNAALVSYNYEKELLDVLSNYSLKYSIINVTKHISVIEIQNSLSNISISGTPQNFKVKITSNGPEVLVVRSNYLGDYIKTQDKYFIIPGYANETYLILLNNTSQSININYEHDTLYVYVMFSYGALIPIILLIILVNNIFKKLK